jgi:hypothetical protein
MPVFRKKPGPAPLPAMIVDLTQRHRAKVGEQFIPVIMWIVHTTNEEDDTPYLGVGLIEEDRVERARFVQCDELDCKIAQHIPDRVLARYPSAIVDVDEQGKLVFSTPSA